MLYVVIVSVILLLVLSHSFVYNKGRQRGQFDTSDSARKLMDAAARASLKERVGYKLAR